MEKLLNLRISGVTEEVGIVPTNQEQFFHHYTKRAEAETGEAAGRKLLISCRVQQQCIGDPI